MLHINQRYPYQEFQRQSVNGRRLYANPYGDPVPSVTTILDATKPKEKREALANWKKRVGVEEAARITREAADTGTYMHAILEHWVKNEEYTGQSSKQSQFMAEVVKQNVEPHLNEVWGSEVNLCFPGLYAGTTDLVGVWKGQPAIMDFKQTNKPKKREWIDDYFMQAAAYAMAHNELYETKIENAAIFMCSRSLDWQLFEVGPEEFKHWETKWAERVAEFYELV